MANSYSKRSRFRLVDAAWLHMGTAPTQTTIGGLLLLEDPLPSTQLKQLLRARLLRFRKFQQRVREPLLGLIGPIWEDDPRFDLDAHVLSTTLDEPNNWTCLREFYEDLMAHPLDPQRPLWQMHLVEHYGEGSALIIRVEHAMADGIALMHVLETITDDAPITACFDPMPERETSLLLAAFDRFFTVGRFTIQSLQALPAQSLKQVRHPRRFTQQGIATAKAFGKLVFSPPDPQTILRGKRSTAHRVAFSDPIALADIKAVGRTLGGTVNDVLLCAITGGFRRYLLRRGEHVQQLEFRGFVPVNLRRDAFAPDLGNAFGLAFLDLPVGSSDPLERLQELKGRMDDIKQTPEAQVAYLIFHLMGMIPRSIEHIFVRFFCMKGTAAMTNVAGPEQPRYLASSRIHRIMFSVPHPDAAAVGMSIMSYDGNVIVTIDTDSSIIPDPDDIIAGFHADYVLLQAQAAGAQEKQAHIKKDGQRAKATDEARVA